MKDLETLIGYYESYDEDSRLVRDNAHKVEFITTTWLLDSMIPPSSRILDVGAGTGRYALYYANRGCRVTAVDIVPGNVAKMTAKFQETGVTGGIEVALGDARNLPQFPDGAFDAVLCFGPLYHLKSASDRIACIRECLRLLKPGGFLALAYINRLFAFADLVKQDPKYLRSATIAQIIDRGVFEDGDTVADLTHFWECAYFSSSMEIEAMMAEFGVKKREHIGTDGISYLLSESVNRLSEDQFATWIEYHLKTCREPSIAGYSCHGLYVCER